MDGNKLIINADDFGYSSNLNAAIVSCFQKEIINSATIMVNMEGFDEAVKLASQHGFADRIGLHINLTEGKPLTDFSGTGLVDENGVFIMEAISNPLLFFSHITKTKIKYEIREQYNKLVASGINPTHFDSHQHVHILPYLVPLFIEFTKEKNQKIRIVTIPIRKNFFIIAYNILLNMRLKRNKINFSDKFGNIGYFDYYLEKKKNFNPVFEIMVHPAFKDDKLVDYFFDTDIEKKIIRIKELYKLKCTIK
jgi:hypothetical protein